MKTVAVYDLSGRLLIRMTTAATEADFGKSGHLPEGLYLVRMSKAYNAGTSFASGF